MVPESSSTSAVDEPSAETRSSTGVNALIGGVSGIVLSFIPFSPLLGGAVAGYLEGGVRNDGLKVGAIAGAIMLLPFTVFGVFFLMFFLGIGGAPLAFGLLALIVLLVGSVYTVGLSALGGYLGVYLKHEL